MEALEKFIKRVEASTKSRSKEIRLNISESQQMTIEIARLLMRENELLEKIINLQNGKTEDGNNPFENVLIQGGIDGGKFSS